MSNRNDGGMQGDLDTFPLLGMLQWLHQTGRSVVMRVDTGGAPGWLFFKQGVLFRCEWRGLRGREAVMALLEVHHGTFWLSKRLLSTGAANISTPTSELLLDCAVALDEKRRLTAA